MIAPVQADLHLCFSKRFQLVFTLGSDMFDYGLLLTSIIIISLFLTRMT